tara:strand:+ start:4105 stop:4215 length:111 start_codon:yes stop_codon:yes gene_type:complete
MNFNDMILNNEEFPDVDTTVDMAILYEGYSFLEDEL